MAQFGKRGIDHTPPRAMIQMSSERGDPSTGDAHPDPAKSAVQHAFLALIAAVGYWLLIVPYVGDLIRDHRLSGSWQPAYDVQVLDARCKRYSFVVTLCSARIKPLARPDQSPVAVDYMMAFVRGADPIVPVRSTLDTSAVTIGSAVQSHLLNRTITFFVLTAAFAALFVIGLLMVMASLGDRNRRSAA